MLILSRKVNESVVLSDAIEIKVLEVTGERVKLGITAPAEVSILRRELIELVGAENVAAAGSSVAKSTDVAATLRRASKTAR